MPWVSLDFRYYVVFHTYFALNKQLRNNVYNLRLYARCYIHLYQYIYICEKIKQLLLYVDEWRTACSRLCSYVFVFVSCSFFLYSFVSIFASPFSVALYLSNLCLYHISTLPRSPPLPSSSSFCILAVFRGILLSTFLIVIGKESRVTLPRLLSSRFVVVREATEALKTSLYRTTSYCVLSPLQECYWSNADEKPWQFEANEVREAIWDTVMPGSMFVVTNKRTYIRVSV